MKLYIKEKVFSWGDKFTVKDAYGEDKYIVEGEVFSSPLFYQELENWRIYEKESNSNNRNMRHSLEGIN